MKISYLLSKLIKKAHLSAIKDSIIHKSARVCSGSHLVNVTLGKYSYFGYFCTAINVKIGNFCSVADNCIIGGAHHPIEWVSTSPVFHSGKNIMRKNFYKHEFDPSKETAIVHDVWIGNNCTIRSGVNIGTGSVIGMGSVLTKDVGEYEIWAGNPAHLIRKRFSDDIITKLIDSEWWNWDDEAIPKQQVKVVRL